MRLAASGHVMRRLRANSDGLQQATAVSSTVSFRRISDLWGSGIDVIRMVRSEGSEDRDSTRNQVLAAEAAGGGNLPVGDQLVPAASGRGGQGRQDGTHLCRGGAVVRRRSPSRG